MSNLKPEHVLKRANDLINSAVGTNGEKEKRMARDQLHQIICVKKKNVWTKSFELLMRRHIELCVDLKDYATAKDGLHQYRNLCFASDPASLENVILYLLELSEDRALKAKQKAERVALAAAASVVDLDQQEASHSIMLSSMTEEGTKERTYRELVVPWLRFLWENYRAVLELVYKLPKLEKTYHDACRRAFTFCQQYERTIEFRRLCEMLRLQLVNLQKAPVVAPGQGIHALLAAKKQTQFEWTTETVEAHLVTRFTQLEVARALSLYGEAFRTVEDINMIFLVHRKLSRPKLLLAYYDKLASLFLVAENKLFHAYALLQQYVCAVEFKGKDWKAEDKERLAGHALVAALAVPSIKDIYAAVVEEEEELPVDRSSTLARLLDFQSNPSRQNLLAEIVNKGVLSACSPALRALYDSMEVSFKPLALVKGVAPALETLRSDSSYAVYLPLLEKIVVVKLVQQLSRVYSTLKLDTLHALLKPLSESLKPVQVERILLEAIAHKQLSLRISHSERTLTFTHAQTSASALETQTAQLASALAKVARSLAVTAVVPPAQKVSTTEFLQRVAAEEDEELARVEARKALIERRKEQLEKTQEDNFLQKEQLLVKEKEKREKEEKERLKREEEQRQEEHRKAELVKIEIAKMEQELARIDKVLIAPRVAKTIAELTKLTAEERNNTLAKAQELLAKQKENEVKRQAQELKTRDYTVRAVRMEEATKLPEYLERLKSRDAEFVAGKQAAINETWAVQHKLDLAEKARLQKMQAHRESFETALLQQQRAKHATLVEKKRAQLLEAEREKRLDAARAALQAKYDAEEAEIELERAREEEARLQIEQADALRRAREKEIEKERAVEKHKAEEEERLARMRRQIEEATRAPKPVEETKPAVSVIPRGTPLPPSSAVGAAPAPYRPPSSAASGGAAPYRPPARQESWRGGGGAPAPRDDRDRDFRGPRDDRDRDFRRDGPREGGFGGPRREDSGFGGPRREDRREDSGFGGPRREDRREDSGFGGPRREDRREAPKTNSRWG